MPTEAEIKELVAGCTWSKETINGIPCLRATSKANGKSIVICTAGFMLGNTLKDRGTETAFWTSTLHTPTSTRGRTFVDEGEDPCSPEAQSAVRELGLPIRPVRP